MNPYQLFDRLETAQQQTRRVGAVPLQQALGGEEVQGALGVFHRRRQQLSVELAHGPFPLYQAQSQDLRVWLPELEGRRALYLDTETTGLAGGSGTYAFLIGLAYFEHGHLQVEQLVMRTHSEEKAMLSYLVERLQEADCLVTFNGKSFDVPLLQTRLVMNRQRCDLEEIPHLDLLPVARRLWALALENCRLETLEREILGLPRHDDVPGWMVPQIFFRYLQTGDARGLAQVAEHNRRDLLTMVGLVSGLGGYWLEPLEWNRRFQQQTQLLHLEDLALAQVFFRQRRYPEAECLLMRVWDYFSGQPQPALRQSGSLLARLLRRMGQPQSAQAIWQKLAEHYPKDPELLEQVAKQHEHLTRDCSLALQWVDRALDIKPMARGRRNRLILRRKRLQRRLQLQAN